jgi:hypothetical protein
MTLRLGLTYRPTEDGVVLDCAFCGGQPTFEPAKPDGTVWDKAGRYVCLNVWCCGQGRSAKICFRYERNWNHRQKLYGRAIEKAKCVVAPLWRDSRGSA